MENAAAMLIISHGGATTAIFAHQIQGFQSLLQNIQGNFPDLAKLQIFLAYEVGTIKNCLLRSESDYQSMLALINMFPPHVATISVTSVRDLFGDSSIGLTHSTPNAKQTHSSTPKSNTISQYFKSQKRSPGEAQSSTTGGGNKVQGVTSRQYSDQTAGSSEAGIGAQNFKEASLFETSKSKSNNNTDSEPSLFRTQSSSIGGSNWEGHSDSVINGEYVASYNVEEENDNGQELGQDDGDGLQFNEPVGQADGDELNCNDPAYVALKQQEKKERRAKMLKQNRIDRKRKEQTGNWFEGVYDIPSAYQGTTPTADKPLMSAGWIKLIHGIGQEFKGGLQQFRLDLCKYASKLGFHFKYSRNDSRYVQAFCKLKDSDKCKWFVNATLDTVTGSAFIKKCDMYHTCSLSVMRNDTSRMSAELVAGLVLEKIRTNPTLSPTAVRQDIITSYGFHLSYMQVWRGVEQARASIFGDYESSFDELRWYKEAIVSNNPGSIVYLECQPVTNKFVRFFFAFNASLKGFKHCRPMLFIDGTFMNNRYKGTILAATAKDGNQGLFPVAFAIVESETQKNWEWFISLVQQHVKHQEEILYISDRAGGILAAFDTLQKKSRHFFCIWHLMKNIREKYSVKKYSEVHRNTVCNRLSKVAYAPTMRLFEEALAELMSVGGEIVANWLTGVPYDRWCIAFSPDLLRYGELTSNAAESFNSWILGPRSLPITYLIDSIRTQLMTWFVDRRKDGLKQTGALTTTMEAKWNKFTGLVASWPILVSRADIEFEVLSEPSTKVNIVERTCSCWEWQIRGFPCVHAVAVINRHKMNIKTIIDPYYFTNCYRRVYLEDIHAVPTTDRYEFIDMNTPEVIHAPNLKKATGRPHKKRFRTPADPLIRKEVCLRCGKMGRHVWETCGKALE